MPIRVASWNLYHGRSQPPLRRDLLPEFVEALAAQPWDVCALQEVPPWWPAQLGAALGASVRTTRTSLLRATAAPAQRRVHERDPEVIGVRGAGVNALLVRASAGRIVEHRGTVLRRAPQRRTMHGVRLARPGGEELWVVNLHAHNRPLDAAARDLRLALRTASGWAGWPDPQAASLPARRGRERVATAGAAGTGDRDGAPAVPLLVIGDVNLKAPAAAAVGRTAGYAHLHGDHVDQVLARGLQLAAPPTASRAHVHGGGPALSDHRLIVACTQPMV